MSMFQFPLFALLAIAVPSILGASTIINFEGLGDGTILTTQYAGLTFSNAIVLTAGISLNEFEFPPHSGANVASDNGGPMSITFSTPVLSFGGYFTYAEPLTLDAFGMGSTLLTSKISSYSNNEALSGVPGTSPNEFLEISSTKGISRVTITGDPLGGSFVLDDVAVALMAPVPEPNTILLIMVSVLIAIWFSRLWSRRPRLHSELLSVGLCICSGLSGASTSDNPTVGIVAVTPSVIAAGTESTITVSVAPTNGLVIAGSINLLKLDNSGNATGVLATLNDAGVAGDLVSGDGIFTGQVGLNQASAGQISMQVSAAFRGVLQRVKSIPVQITVQAGPVPSYTLFVNANDPLLLQGTAPTGEVVQYFGRKNSAGLATSVTGFTVTDSANHLTRYAVDTSGRPTQILAPNNALFNLIWSADGSVKVTGIAPDGSVQTTVNVPPSSAAALGKGVSAMTTGMLSKAQHVGQSSNVVGQYLEVDVSKCGVGDSGESVWMTVSYPLTGAFADVFQGVDEGGGVYAVQLPAPDPHAGANIESKCSAALGAMGDVCEAHEANPLLGLQVCSALSLGFLPIAPEVIAVCGEAFEGLDFYCDTLGSGPSDALDQYVCPKLGEAVNRIDNLPVDLELTVNGQTRGSRLGVSPNPPFAPFSVALACNPVQLNVVKSNSGSGTGTVSASPSVINCGGVCSDSFLPPSVVQLKANPDSNSKFTSWGGECDGTSDSTSVPISLDSAASMSCLATFDLASQQKLTVSKLGTGQGAVTSVPSGINCGPTCSASFNTGSPVSLTAAPLTGFTFSSWGGDCASGGATPVITLTPTTPLTCSATFGGPVPAVALNPFGSQTTLSAPGPYLVRAVNPQSPLVGIAAPADITVSVNRRAVTCSITFDQTSDVLISQGSLSGVSVPNAFAVGRDQSCPNTPVITTWTILGATIAPNNTALDLSKVEAERTLSVTR